MSIRPRFVMAILLGLILLLLSKILLDYPMGRNKVSELYRPSGSEDVMSTAAAERAIERAIEIDESTWLRAEIVTNQAAALALLGIVSSAAAIYFAGDKWRR